MALTQGINHLGLTVKDLDITTAFFTDVLGWTLKARDDVYPRTTVTDGDARLTLWQADTAHAITEFDRRSNIGLHHVAFSVADRATLDALASKISATEGAQIEFPPEFMGSGPRMHMIFAEPGGLRIELVWAGD